MIGSRALLSLRNKNVLASCLVVLCLCASCGTLRKAELSSNEIRLTSNNLQRLNGTYSRASRDTTCRVHITNDLTDNLYPICHEGDRVSLSVLSSRRIVVTLLNETDTIRKRVFKGKIEDSLFKFRRRVKVIPVIIGNVCWNGKTRIGLLANGNISVDAKQVVFGHLMIFPVAGSTKAFEAEHAKLN